MEPSIDGMIGFAFAHILHSKRVGEPTRVSFSAPLTILLTDPELGGFHRRRKNPAYGRQRISLSNVILLNK